MNSKTTAELEDWLQSINPKKLNEFYKENAEQLYYDEKSFARYFKETVKSKGVRLKDVYLCAGVPEKYGASILSMEKHTSNRDKILKLCIAAHFNLDEISRAMKLYGMAPLYAKDPRDAVLIMAVSRRLFDIDEINLILEDSGFDILELKEVE